MTIHDLSRRQSIWLVTVFCLSVWAFIYLAVDFLTGGMA